MTTKELEAKLALSKHTIRYYEKEDFITPLRDENGYRNYSDTDLQTLLLVKFLRNLNISIDDTKAIIAGKLDLNTCLKINQIALNNHLKDLQEIKEKIDLYVNKNLPLIPALSTINKTADKGKLGFQKSTPTVSLGRRLTHQLAIKKLIIATFMAIIITLLLISFLLRIYSLPFYWYLLLTITIFLILDFLFISTNSL